MDNCRVHNTFDMLQAVFMYQIRMNAVYTMNTKQSSNDMEANKYIHRRNNSDATAVVLAKALIVINKLRYKDFELLLLLVQAIQFGLEIYHQLPLSHTSKTGTFAFSS